MHLLDLFFHLSWIDFIWKLDCFFTFILHFCQKPKLHSLPFQTLLSKTALLFSTQTWTKQPWTGNLSLLKRNAKPFSKGEIMSEKQKLILKIIPHYHWTSQYQSNKVLLQDWISISLLNAVYSFILEINLIISNFKNTLKQCDCTMTALCKFVHFGPPGEVSSHLEKLNLYFVISENVTI